MFSFIGEAYIKHEREVGGLFGKMKASNDRGKRRQQSIMGNALTYMKQNTQRHK